MSPLRDGLALARRHARFVRFVIAGGFCAGLFFCVYYAALLAGSRPFVANLAAYAISFSVGYFLQRGWTFGARHRHGHALPRYAAVQTCCALLTSAVSQFAAPHLPVDKLVLSIMATAVAGAASYVASLLWVFPNGDAEHSV